MVLLCAFGADGSCQIRMKQLENEMSIYSIFNLNFQRKQFHPIKYPTDPMEFH